MAQIYNRIVIDIQQKYQGMITAKQSDAKSRFLDVSLKNNGEVVNLTGHEVRLYGKKHDGTEIYSEAVITEPTNGRFQVELTNQTLAVANDLEVEFVVFFQNTQILSTIPFTVHVVRSLMSDNAIESTNEYGALVVLYQNLYEAYDLMVEMVQKIGVPGVEAKALSLSTMFQVWDYMIVYLKANSTAGMVDLIKGLQTKSNIKSVQRGTITFNSTTGAGNVAIAISPVDPDKCSVTVNSRMGSAVWNYGTLTYTYASIVSSLTLNTLTITANYYLYSSTYAYGSASWEIIENY